MVQREVNWWYSPWSLSHFKRKRKGRKIKHKIHLYTHTVRGLLRESKTQPGPHRGTKSFNTPLPPFILSLARHTKCIISIHPPSTHTLLSAHITAHKACFSIRPWCYLYSFKNSIMIRRTWYQQFYCLLWMVFIFIYTHTLSAVRYRRVCIWAFFSPLAPTRCAHGAGNINNIIFELMPALD
jgi:hypothetical protein